MIAKRLCSALVLAIALAFTGNVFAKALTQAELRKCSPALLLLLKQNQPDITRFKRDFGMSMTRAGITYEILIKSADPALAVPGVVVEAKLGDIATARATAPGIRRLAELASVQWIEISKTLHPALDVSCPETGAQTLHRGHPAYRGKGVLVGVFDSGIDFRHEDFIDEQGHSRIIYLWDMTDDGGPHPNDFNYGTEYTREQIDAEIDGSPTGLVREKDTNGHGTHVAGIAAGDGSATGHGEPAYTFIGMAPLADLIIVKGGNGGFTTKNQVNGLAYILKKAKELGRPVALNFSIAGHWGPHDGTSLHEQAIDAAVGTGRAIVVAAANEGADPIHASGFVGAGQALTTDFEVDEGKESFWVDIWHSGNDRMRLAITTPGGYSTPLVESGSLEEWQQWDTDNGRIELIAPGKNSLNGDYEFSIYVSNEGGTAVKAGAWHFELQGMQITSGRFDAWTQQKFTSNVDKTMLVGMPGTARGALTVASYDTKKSWKALDGNTYRYTSDMTLGDISWFSSPGPTRDGRTKPEIAAPGHGIASAISADSDPRSTRIMPDGVHFVTQGTSMAAPHVAGAAALLFEKNPFLTSQDIKSLLENSAYTDAYTGGVWNRYWGYGKMDIKAAIGMIPGDAGATAAQHSTGSINVRISDWGEVAANSDDAPGFRFPATSAMDHGGGGSLVLGVWGDDMADSFGSLDRNQDDTWRTTETGQLRITGPGSNADEEGYAQFAKWLLTPSGLTRVQVTQHSYAWQNWPNDQFILLDYEITNLGPLPLVGLLAGFYMDWDVQPNYKTNDAGYDSQRNLAYMWDAGSANSPYLGIAILGQSPAAFKIIDNKASVYPTFDLPDATFYRLLQAPGYMNSIGQGDLSVLLGTAATTLQNGASMHFAIALVAGENLADLKQSAAYAHDKFNLLNRQVTDLYYDDGSAEGGVFVTTPGERIAVKFTPVSYPAHLDFATFYTRAAEAGIQLQIYDDDGPAGRPGTPLLAYTPTITPQANSWNRVDLQDYNLQISSGHFYISMQWLTSEQPVLGYDEQFPHAGRSWYFDGIAWSNFIDDGDPWDKRDVMIGAGLSMPTGVVEAGSNNSPLTYRLYPNYPNPFNPSTTIVYSLPRREHVCIKIFDLMGRKIAEPVNAVESPGIHRLQFSAASLPSGVYLYKIETPHFVATEKMIVIK